MGRQVVAEDCEVVGGIRKVVGEGDWEVVEEEDKEVVGKEDRE